MNHNYLLPYIVVYSVIILPLCKERRSSLASTPNIGYTLIDELPALVMISVSFPQRHSSGGPFKGPFKDLRQTTTEYDRERHDEFYAFEYFVNGKL